MELNIEEIVDQFSKKLLRYADSILCNRQDAEDIVQEVFMTAYQNRERFDGRHLSAWLYKMTYNSSIDKIRKRRILPFAEVPGQRVNPKEEKDFDLSDASLTAFSRLKPQERALLHGRIIDDYDYDELSKQMGLSAATLRKRYERAKQKFATILKEVHENEKI